LKTGRVLLLQGSDAVLVTKISHSHGQLLVSTKAAQLPQLIKSGKLTFSGPPNFRGAFVAPTITSSKFKAAADFRRPSYPYVGPPPATRARTAAGVTFSVQGSSASAPFGYSLSFTPSGSTKLDVAGVICFQWGTICSNGPSNGLSLEANLSGYIDFGSESASVAVNGGRITQSSFSLKSTHAHLKLTYTGARGTGPDSGGDPPVFHVPIGLDYPVVVGGIPLYFKLQTAILVKLGMSSKNTVLRGGVEYDTSGSDTITTKGKSFSDSASGSNPSGMILDNGNGGTGPSVALGAGGVVVAVQFPKIGIGLGVRALNGIGYIDMITSMGGSNPGAISGGLAGGCQYDLYWSIGGGFEAQLGPFGIAGMRHILFPTDGQQYHFGTKSPSC
jgi:hypothetical protein